MLAMPLASAATTHSFTREIRSSFDRDVNIPRDNVLAALALGVRGHSAFDRIANVHQRAFLDTSFDNDFRLDDRDVLLLLALRGDGGFSSDLLGFAPFFRTGSLSTRDLVLLHEFDNGRLGWWDFPDSFDSSRWWRTTWHSHSAFDRLSDDDLLLLLALRNN